MLTKAFSDNAASVVARWWKLFDVLLFKYADGWLNEPGNLGQALSYPDWWLKKVGYQNGPPSIPYGETFAKLPPKLGI